MAWALNIHKSQGLTLRRSTIDIGNEHQVLTFYNIKRNVNCTIVLLQTLFKDERHFICLTLKEGRGTLPFFVHFTLKIATLNHCTPLHQMKIPMLIANIIRVKLDHYLALYCFTHICILYCVTN